MSAVSVSRSTVVGTLRAAGCVFAEDEADLIISAADSPAELAAMVDQRVAGLPLEQILGWAEFCGLRIAVEPGVFVPRQRTELLVQVATELVETGSEETRSAETRSEEIGTDETRNDDTKTDGTRTDGSRTNKARTIQTGLGTNGSSRANAGRRVVVLDLCCGSGAIGAALAATLSDIELYAADVESAAVRCARRNIEAVGGRVFQGDLFAPLPASLRGRVDVLAANVPYVPTDAVQLMPPEARLHEPLVALDGGVDGLQMLRRVSGEAARWLAEGGHLLVETSEAQALAAAAILTGDGLVAQVRRLPEIGATVVVGTRPSP